MKTIFLLAVVLCVTGCTTSPVKYSESREVAGERIYPAYDTYSSPKPSGSKVIVVRDSGSLGAGGSAALFVNGEIVARLRTKESIVLHVDTGDNLFGVSPGTKMGWEADSVDLIEQAIQVAKDKIYYYRITIHASQGLILQRTSQI